MSEDKDKLREHEIDGIQEYDNALPQWWVGLFYFTIFFSIGYLVYIHVLDGPSLEEQLVSDLKARQELLAEVETSLSEESVGSSDNKPTKSLMERLTDPGYIAAGKSLYMTNCIACHGGAGEGGIGPNLADNYWIHGGENDDVLRTVSVGVAAKGMPGWKAVLGPKKTEQVSAYVISLIGTNPPNPKDPQGDLYERK